MPLATLMAGEAALVGSGRRGKPRRAIFVTGEAARDDIRPPFPDEASIAASHSIWKQFLPIITMRHNSLLSWLDSSRAVNTEFE